MSHKEPDIPLPRGIAAQQALDKHKITGVTRPEAEEALQQILEAKDTLENLVGTEKATRALASALNANASEVREKRLRLKVKTRRTGAQKTKNH